MIMLDRDSERYAPTGNIASEGVRNQLGRPRLDRLTVLVREAVQNCWDAAAPGGGGVRIHLALSEASPEQRALLRGVVFADPARELPITRHLEDPSRPFLLLTISDRGTTGLGGPTRADLVWDDDERHDFVDFLRNLGQPPDKQLGGGTFGYGKAALYAASHLRTILVHTRCLHEGQPQSRLLCAALGPGFAVPGAGPGAGRFTGRHWWGRRRDGIVEPLLADEADGLARALGLPGFDGAERGTSILIVDFDPGADDRLGADATPRTPEEAMRFLSEALLWNFWPKMVAGEDGRLPIRFTATLNGVLWRLKGPDDEIGLKAMVQALRAVRRREAQRSPDPGVTLEKIWVGQGRRQDHMGWAGIATFPTPPGAASQAPDPATGAPGAAPHHHIALMRSAELVVRYEEGPPLETDLLGYAGVFRVTGDVQVDRAFAASEPPTHDDWVEGTPPEPLQRTRVRVGMQRVRAFLKKHATPVAPTRPAGERTSLAPLATALGGILVGLPGPGGGVEKPEETTTKPPRPVVIEDPPHEPPADPTPDGPVIGGGQTPPRSILDEGAPPTPPGPLKVGRPRVRTKSAQLAIEDGVGVLRLEVVIQHGNNSEATLVQVRPHVLVDGGGRETAPPEGAPVPQVHGWRDPSGAQHRATGSTLRVPAAQDGAWTLYVRLIDDAEIEVDVSGVAAEAP